MKSVVEIQFQQSNSWVTWKENDIWYCGLWVERENDEIEILTEGHGSVCLLTRILVGESNGLSDFYRRSSLLVIDIRGRKMGQPCMLRFEDCGKWDPLREYSRSKFFFDDNSISSYATAPKNIVPDTKKFNLVNHWLEISLENLLENPYRMLLKIGLGSPNSTAWKDGRN